MTRTPIDIPADTKINRWTVLRLATPEESLYGKRCWLCRCKCGNEKVVEQNALRSGNTKSCGCLRNDPKSAANDSPPYVPPTTVTYHERKLRFHDFWSVLLLTDRRLSLPETVEIAMRTLRLNEGTVREMIDQLFMLDMVAFDGEKRLQCLVKPHDETTTLYELAGEEPPEVPAPPAVKVKPSATKPTPPPKAPEPPPLPPPEPENDDAAELPIAEIDPTLLRRAATILESVKAHEALLATNEAKQQALERQNREAVYTLERLREELAGIVTGRVIIRDTGEREHPKFNADLALAEHRYQAVRAVFVERHDWLCISRVERFAKLEIDQAFPALMRLEEEGFVKNDGVGFWRLTKDIRERLTNPTTKAGSRS